MTPEREAARAMAREDIDSLLARFVEFLSDGGGDVGPAVIRLSDLFSAPTPEYDRPAKPDAVALAFFCVGLAYAARVADGEVTGRHSLVAEHLRETAVTALVHTR